MYFKSFLYEKDKYTIVMTDDFYKYCQPLYEKGSYFNIVYRLFGLLPQDFYHYVGYKYNAFFMKSDSLKNYVKMFFKTKKDVDELVKELNRRFDYCVKNGYFD